MSTSLSSRSENEPRLPEELVEKAGRAMPLSPTTFPTTQSAVEAARVVLDAIDLSSILRERDEAREELLERQRHAPLICDKHITALDSRLRCTYCWIEGLTERLEAAEGDRDRLREWMRDQQEIWIESAERRRAAGWDGAVYADGYAAAMADARAALATDREVEL